MAEAVASGITIATLFKGCIEAFDLVQTVRHQEDDLKHLVLKFNIEKCRLFIWGKVMGLTVQVGSRDRHPLRDLEMQNLVREILQNILEILQSTRKMRDQYGCEEMPDILRIRGPDPQTQPSDIDNLARAFSHFRITKLSSDKSRTIVSRARWLIHDRKRFNELVEEARGLITRLHEITAALFSLKDLEDLLTRGMQQVGDADTLQHVAEVTEIDYPDVSDAASNRADALTMEMNERMNIETWMNDVGQPINNDDTESIENSTMTEMKLKIQELKHRIEAEAKSRSAATEPARKRPRLNHQDFSRDFRDVDLRTFVPSGYIGRIHAMNTLAFQQGLKARNVDTQPSRTFDSLGTAIRSLKLEDFFQETEQARSQGNKLWMMDLATLGLTYNETMFHQTMMMNLLDRTSVMFEKEINGEKLLDYSATQPWDTSPMPSRAVWTAKAADHPKGKFLVQPRPDLAICFRRQALIKYDLWKSLPKATKTLPVFENQYPSKVFHFFALEATSSAKSVDDPENLYKSLNNASQALNNLYEFLQDAGSKHKRIFFDRVRFFSAVANAHGMIVRIHKATEVPPDADEDRLILPDRPEYRLQFEYQEFSRLVGCDFTREAVIEILRKVCKYAVEELSVFISQAAEDLVNNLHQSEDPNAFTARADPSFYRHGQPCPNPDRSNSWTSQPASAFRTPSNSRKRPLVASESLVAPESLVDSESYLRSRMTLSQTLWRSRALERSRALQESDSQVSES